MFDHCRVVLQMMGSSPPLEGLATDQLAADTITSLLKDTNKTVLNRSNMEQKAKFMQIHACQNSPFMLKSFGFVQHMVLAQCSLA